MISLSIDLDLRTGPGISARRTVTAPAPDNWYGSWHRVTGVYDGSAVRLYLDGTQVGEAPASGAIPSVGPDTAVGQPAAAAGSG